MKKGQRPRFFYGWFIVGACLCMGITHSGVLNPMLSLFMKPMATEFGWTRAMFSATVLVSAIGGSVLSIVMGPIIDKKGPRVVMSLGAAIIGGCLAAISRVQALWHFYVLLGSARSVMGGATRLSISVAIANWFIRKRGRAMGIALAGMWVGGILLTPIIQWLISIHGWRFAWMVLGFLLGAIACIPTAILVRRRPEDIGMLPDGEVPNESKEAITSSESLESDREVSSAEPVWTRKAAVATSAFWLLAIAEAQAALALGAVNMHKFPYMTDINISPTVAVLAVSVTFLISSISGFLWGLLTERIHPKHCLSLAFLMLALSVLILLYTRTTAMVYIFAVIWGLSSAGMISLVSVVWAQYFGRISLASIQGLSLPLRLFANASGPIIASLVFDLAGDYKLAFIAFITIFLISSFLIFLSKAPQYPPKLMENRNLISDV